MVPLTTLTAGDDSSSFVEAAELEKWMSARNELQRLHVDNAAQWPSLQAMSSFIPKVFHRRPEMSNKDSRDIRAVLDYVMYLQNSEDSEAARQRRQRKEPHMKKAVVKALRDILPAKSYAEFKLTKEEVEDDDVAIVVLAARFYLLELTEGKSGEGLLGTKTFAGVAFVKCEDGTSTSHEGSSPHTDELTITNATPTQNTTLEIDLIGLSEPFSARSTGTTASELLDNFTNPLDTVSSPSRRISVPVQEPSNDRRSRSNKRSASENRGQASKRKKIDGTIDEEKVPEAQLGRSELRASLVTATAMAETSMNEIMTGLVEGGLRARKIVDDQNNMILELRDSLSAREQELAALKTTVQKQRLDLACQKEVRKAVTEKSTRLEDENAVLRALSMANGVTEDQINAQLTNITGI